MWAKLPDEFQSVCDQWKVDRMENGKNLELGTLFLSFYRIFLFCSGTVIWAPHIL